MIPMDIVSSLLLSVAIALSFGEFRLIFSGSTEEAVLRSPATTLASTICLTASGLAFSSESIGVGTLVVSAGFLFGGLVRKSSVRAPIAITLSLAGLALFLHFSIRP